jgi:hypothetical protein
MTKKAAYVVLETSQIFDIFVLMSLLTVPERLLMVVIKAKVLPSEPFGHNIMNL